MVTAIDELHAFLANPDPYKPNNEIRVHEVLDTNATIAGTLPSKIVGWEVRVVESHSSWSSNLHQHSRSSNVRTLLS